MDHSEKHSQKRLAAILSILASGGLAVGKFVVGTLTGSLGIISEAIHSLVDFFATVITYAAVRFGDMPADDNHHYGHEKIESLAALVETGLLFATSAWIVYEAADRIFGGHGMSVEVTWYALAVIVASVAVDFFRARNLMRVAKATNSQALEADALHFSSDMWSSVAVLVGLAGVLAGFAWADAASALVVSFMVARAGYGLGKRSIEVLIDTAPEGVSDRIRAIAAATPGVCGVLDVRVRTFEGTTLSGEVLVALDENMVLRDAVGIKTRISEAVEAEYPSARIVVHADLCETHRA